MVLATNPSTSSHQASPPPQPQRTRDSATTPTRRNNSQKDHSSARGNYPANNSPTASSVPSSSSSLSRSISQPEFRATGSTSDTSGGGGPSSSGGVIDGERALADIHPNAIPIRDDGVLGRDKLGSNGGVGIVGICADSDRVAGPAHQDDMRRDGPSAVITEPESAVRMKQLDDGLSGVNGRGSELSVPLVMADGSVEETDAPQGNGDGQKSINHPAVQNGALRHMFNGTTTNKPALSLAVVGNKAPEVMTAERPAVKIGESPSINAAAQSPSKVRTRGLSPGRGHEKEKILKLSPAKIHELTSSPESLSLHTLPLVLDRRQSNPLAEGVPSRVEERIDASMGRGISSKEYNISRRKSSAGKVAYLEDSPELISSGPQTPSGSNRRKSQGSRTVSTPENSRRRRSSAGGDRSAHTRGSRAKQDRRIPSVLDLSGNGSALPPASSIAPERAPSSPVPTSIPLPPLSVPTYLQLELSSGHPSPLYIHRSSTHDFPYESSQVKLERLQNFLLLPPSLEQVLFFGTLACLDSWLYSFTILPLRFCKSIFILLQSWATNLGVEAQFISSFIFKGIGRVWRRRRRTGSSAGADRQASDSITRSRSHSSNANLAKSQDPFIDGDVKHKSQPPSVDEGRRHRGSVSRRHRRKKSVPSALLPDDKADILKGLLMISTCLVLMYFDASRMYHWIRGQAAIKLYVIYNVLEVGDRLFSAIGQDVLECLFSREALERKPDGRSKVLRPFWLFLLALAYTVSHATALFYQTITLNVAVNSYSNALITLLMSNQFVEIKSTVFKKFEKENIFQLTCADVVERFQLWLMLTIIASRNIVETGGFNLGGSLSTFASSIPSASTNSTPLSNPPRTSSSILPQSFTILPSSILSSLSSVNSFLPTIGHIMGPFLVVLGSEMIVDWLKHAYINKFNNNRPAIYGRFLDILAKDYYTNAFADQNLTRRLGLPVIPLSCLFFRVSVQTYRMFLTAWLPQPASPSLLSPNTTSLTSIHNHYSPSPSPSSSLPFDFSPLPTSLSGLSTFFHSLISHATPSPNSFVPIFTVILILLLYVTLLLAKLLLGIILLSFSRARYKSMKIREREFAASSASSAPLQKPSSSSQPTTTTTANNIPPTSAPATSSSSSMKVSDTIEGAKRVGGWGYVEVGDERRTWIYADDPEGLKKLKDRDERDSNNKKKGGGGIDGIEGVRRYEMVAKRIW
ncbi:hypothetical protein AJ80_09332 [Polytolypa hystricis UAMH7299]|uniref:Cytomegalovirus gH-receptor family protein n=1 Tax=Polytolypa hystricis (strain UAMH7299) TaxID=1447883 RepID=A0A2B7WS12_POLH7|nr:hypothetical protein AJ80_09332 [Polytolypa hystricis UAMH7299]